MGTQSHLPTIRLNELQTIRYQICPDTSGRCCGAGEDLAECLGVLRFPVEDIDGFVPFFWRLGQIPLELWPSWRQEEENLSSVTWCLPSRRFRSAICCQILSSSGRIYLRLPLLAQLDMPQRMCPYVKEHSLGLPRRLGRLSGGPPLRLRHPGDTLNLRLLLLRRSALKLPLLRSVLRPRRSRPIPPGGGGGGGFGGRSLSPFCGPVGFRGVAPHHRPRAGYCPSSLYTADGSNIRHYPSLRYQDAQISIRLVDSS